MANICEQWSMLPSLGRVPCVQRVRREGREGELGLVFLCPSHVAQLCAGHYAHVLSHLILTTAL